MKQKLLWKIMAIAMYAFGVVTFLSATTAHVWHILGIPTYVCTATSFILANIALTLALGKRHEYPMLMLSQGVLLGLVMFGVNIVFPLCSHMATGMLYPTVGMIVLGGLWLVFSNVRIYLPNPAK